MNLDHSFLPFWANHANLIRQASCCWQGRILLNLSPSTDTARFPFCSFVYTAHTTRLHTDMPFIALNEFINDFESLL